MVKAKTITRGPKQSIGNVDGSSTPTPIDSAWAQFFDMLQQFELNMPIARSQPQVGQRRDTLGDE